MTLKKEQHKLKTLQKKLEKYEQKEHKLRDVVIKERTETRQVPAKQLQEAKELDKMILSLRREIVTLLDTMEKQEEGNIGRHVHAVLYTRPHCIQCKMSTKLMDEMGLPYENIYYDNSDETHSMDLDSPKERKRTWGAQKIEKLQRKYDVRAFPLVLIIDDETEEELEFWSGFNPERINHWQEANKGGRDHD